MACSTALLVFLAGISVGLLQPAKGGNVSPIKVVTILEPPFTMRDENDKFIGYIPDMLDAISKRIKTPYTLSLVKDGRYGTPSGFPWGRNNTERWSGMVGEIVHENMTVAAAGLTVTALRHSKVYFTTPFMQAGITGVYLVPEPFILPDPVDHHINLTALTAFRAFGKFTWIAIIVTYFVVAFCMFLINKFDPYEAGCRQNTHGETADRLDLGFQGSLWTLLGGLTKQGYSNSPQSVAGRILLGFWWMFCTITLAMYTAGIFTLLTAESSYTEKEPVHTPMSVDDLLDSSYTFGTVRGGSTYNFFCTTSTFEKYGEMCDTMKTEDGFVVSTAHGIDRVKEGGFVYLTDFPTAHYYAAKNCDLRVLRGVYNVKSYALAVDPSRLALQKQLDTTILDLHEDDTLSRLFRKWFESPSKNCKSSDEKTVQHSYEGLEADGTYAHESHESEHMLVHQGEAFRPISVKMFGGAILIMVLGMIFSLIAFVVEKIYFRRCEKRSGTMRDTSLIYATRLEEAKDEATG